MYASESAARSRRPHVHVEHVDAPQDARCQVAHVAMFVEIATVTLGETLKRLVQGTARRPRARVAAHVEHLVHVGTGSEGEPLLQSLAGEVESWLGDWLECRAAVVPPL